MIPSKRALALFGCLFGLCSSLRADPPANTGDQVAEPPGAQYAIDTELSADLGETLDLHTGAFSFEHVDVSIPGNSVLEVAVRRARRTSDPGFLNRKLFGDWALGIPNITTLVQNTVGWRTDRCTALDPSPLHPTGDAWWLGYNLNIPGVGQQNMLKPNPAHPIYALSGQASFVTNSNWKITCIASIPQGGQGFIAESPDGLKYTFDKLAYEPAPPYNGPGGGGLMAAGGGGGVQPLAPPPGTVFRNVAIMYATKVEDRFGNFVNFNFNASVKPTSITSSDSRTITFAYDAAGTRITTATANGQTWTYGYELTGVKRLISVTRPDSSAWGITFPAVNKIRIQHPFGLAGEYTFASNRELTRTNGIPNNPNKWFAEAIQQRILSGPKLTTVTWNYTYAESGNERTTNVNGPNLREEYVYWRSMDWQEGQLLRVNRYSLDGQSYQPCGGCGSTPTGVPNEVVLNEWQTATWVGSQGITGMNPQADYPKQLKKRTLHRDSGSFYVENLSYNSYGAPGTINSWRAAATVRSEAHTFQNSTAPWLINQPVQVSVNGTLADQYIYYTNGTVRYHYRFGALLDEFSYYADGTLATRKDALANTTTYLDYYRGIAREVRYPELVTLFFTVNATGTIASYTSGEGHTTGFLYDSLGRLTRVNYPQISRNWHPTIKTYQLATAGEESGVVAGQWKVTTTRGNRQTVEYLDGEARVRLAKDRDIALGINIYRTFASDFNGQQTYAGAASSSVAGSDAVGTAFVFDALQRLRTATNTADTSQTVQTYFAGNQYQVRDPRFYTTTLYRSGFGHPDEGFIEQIVQPEGVTTVMTRDIFGNLQTVTQSGSYGGSGVSATRNYYYDSNLRLCKVVHPELGKIAYAHDLASRLAWYAEGATGSSTSCDLAAVLSSEMVLLSYDGLNRRTLVNYPDASSDSAFTYDKNSAVKTANRGGANWQYFYDELGGLTSETLAIDGRSYPMAYVYEDHGYRSQSTFPTGLVIAHLPDAFGRARQAGAYASGITYHPNDAMSALAYANGQNLSVTLNSRRMPEHYLSTKGATVALDLTYSYDTAFNVTQITDGVNAANNRTLGYDGINRLTSAAGPWGGGSVAYDPLGNIRQYVTGAWALTLNYDAGTNRLASTSGSQSASYSYDGRGNIVGNGFQTFAFDRADEITTVNGTLAAYQYDAHGKRVRTVSGGSTVYSIYGANGVLLHKDNATTAARTNYVYAAGQLVVEVGASVTYIHGDQLGSPVAGTDSAGNVAWAERYAPYGDQLLAPPATQDNVAYAGHHSDAVTGLIYMEARYYDPLIGRFYSNDPVGFRETNPVSFNRYAYANNNPYTYTDPNGQSVWTKLGKIGFAIVRGGDVASAFVDNVNDIRTLTNPEASTLDKVLAAVSLASELAPVSVSDVKDARRVLNAVRGDAPRGRGAFGGQTRSEAYGNPSSSAAARTAREQGAGQPCPSCGETMRTGTPTAPQAQHQPSLSDHYNEHGGSTMTPAERRAYARSEESINGANCATCQREEGRAMREKYQ